MSNIGFVGIDTIFSKFHRDIEAEEVSEIDIVEWTGEALEFLKVPSLQTQSVHFAEVKDFEADSPEGFQKVIMVAQHMNWTPKEKCNLPQEIYTHVPKSQQHDCDSDCSDMCELNSYLPFADLNWQYIDWAKNPFYVSNYRIVKPTKNAFFNSIMCNEYEIPYEHCTEEFSIVGTVERKFRFSFKDGYVAIAYYKNEVDDSGYPLVPDNISYITAITYYIRWKNAERYAYSGREGFAFLARDNERLWNKYALQGKNFAKILESGGQVFNNVTKY